MAPRLSERLHHALIDDDRTDRDELPPGVTAAIPANSTRQISALTLQKVGDLIVDTKTVLTWVLAATGAPTAFVGLLVPIRDAGAMVPQILLAPYVRRLAQRRWVWVVGALVQAVAVVLMAAVAATLTGGAAGLGILATLTLFALARSASSFAAKDVLGRTLPKGVRGQVSGLATVGAGIAAITVGLAMRALGGQDTPPSTFAWLLAGGALTWIAAAIVYAGLREAPGERGLDGDVRDALRGALSLFRDDRPFRRFVLARSLLLVSALGPPFVVSLATTQGGAGLDGLATFVIASGVASLVGGRFWGRRSDRSSRRTMQWAAGLSSTIIVAFVIATRSPQLAQLTPLYPATYLLLAIAHTGSRLGRSTYVVDLAEGNQRTDYVAVSNTAMGLILLLAGGLSAAIAALGAEAALLFLAALGALGVLVAASLPEVSAPA
ncbi:MAG: MFS transporter [Nitriliruptor sp.]